MCFTVKFDQDALAKLESSEKIWKKLKLQQTLSISNMHLHDAEGYIKKYSNPIEILTEFYETRLMMYTKRKEYMIGKLSRELDVLKWKKTFIEYVLDNKIIIYKQKKEAIIAKLVEFGFPKLSTSDKETDSEQSESKCSYDYITDMKLFNLTEEKIAELVEKYNNKEQELRKVESTSETEQWIIELDEFVEAYKVWFKTYSVSSNNKNVPKKAVSVKPVTTIAKALAEKQNAKKITTNSVSKSKVIKGKK